MHDDTVVDTERASAHWNEATEFDGRDRVSLMTGSQWNHQRLYRSKKGRYYIVSWSDWQGSVASAEWVSAEDATRWLLLNHYPIPEELAAIVDEVSE